MEKKTATSPENFDVVNKKRRIRDKYIKRLQAISDKYGVEYSELSNIRRTSTEDFKRLAYESYRRFPSNSINDFERFIAKDRLDNAEVLLQKELIPKVKSKRNPKKLISKRVGFDEATRIIRNELDKRFKSRERVTTKRKKLNEALALAKTKTKTSDSTIRSLRIELASNPNFSFDNLKGKLTAALADKITNEYEIWFGKGETAREDIEAKINYTLASDFSTPVVKVKPDTSGDRNTLFYALSESLSELKQIYENKGDGGVIWKLDNLAGKGGAVFVIIESQVVEYINSLDDVIVSRVVKALGSSNLGDFEAYGSTIEYSTADDYTEDIDASVVVGDIVRYFKEYINRLAMKYLNAEIAEVEKRTKKKFNRNVYPNNLSREDLRIYKKAVEEYERKDREKGEQIEVFREGDE